MDLLRNVWYGFEDGFEVVSDGVVGFALVGLGVAGSRKEAVAIYVDASA